MLNLWSPISHPSVWGTWSRGWAHSIANPWVPISSPLTNILFVFSYNLHIISKNCQLPAPCVPRSVKHVWTEGGRRFKPHGNTILFATAHVVPTRENRRCSPRYLDSCTHVHWLALAGRAARLAAAISRVNRFILAMLSGGK